MGIGQDVKRLDVGIASVLFLLVVILMVHNHVPTQEGADGVDRRTQAHLAHGSLHSSSDSTSSSRSSSSSGPTPKLEHEQSFTLVNSFWANKPNSTCIGIAAGYKHPQQLCQTRHDEMLGAMRANMLNPALTELYVL